MRNADKIRSTDRSTPCPTPARAAARALLIKAAFGLPAIILAGTAITGSASARDDHSFKICHGYYALCAASTCTRTGKTITVNVAGGGTARYRRSSAIARSNPATQSPMSWAAI